MRLKIPRCSMEDVKNDGMRSGRYWSDHQSSEEGKGSILNPAVQGLGLMQRTLSSRSALLPILGPSLVLHALQIRGTSASWVCHSVIAQLTHYIVVLHLRSQQSLGGEFVVYVEACVLEIGSIEAVPAGHEDRVVACDRFP